METIVSYLENATVWVLFSFIIFSVFAYRAAKDKMIGALDDRIEEIRKELDSAESLRVEAQELLAQYERKHRDATKEADGIIKTAEENAQNIRVQAEKDIDDMMARRETKLQERLSHMEASAIQEIQAHAAKMAVKATAEIIAENLDKKANSNLINQSIEALPKKISA